MVDAAAPGRPAPGVRGAACARRLGVTLLKGLEEDAGALAQLAAVATLEDFRQHDIGEARRRAAPSAALLCLRSRAAR